MNYFYLYKKYKNKYLSLKGGSWNDPDPDPDKIELSYCEQQEISPKTLNDYLLKTKNLNKWFEDQRLVLKKSPIFFYKGKIKSANKYDAYNFPQLSNMYTEEGGFFVDDGIKFCCTEQYMMYKKAELFKDKEAQDEIINYNRTHQNWIQIAEKERNSLLMKPEMSAVSDKDLDIISNQKSARTYTPLGRKVKHFDEDIWNNYKLAIVFNGLLLKFNQIESCKKALFNTGLRLLVETNPYDNIWGIGKEMDDEELSRDWQTSTRNWGSNWMGNLLMYVRFYLFEADDLLKIDKSLNI